MYNDEEKEIREIINRYRKLTKNIPDEIAMNALDSPIDFAFLNLVALAGKGDVAHTSNAILLATKLGILSGYQAASKAHFCQE